MANLTKAQIDELKEKGFITQVVPSDDLASKTVDGLKIEEYITVTDPSTDIEADVTHEIPVESITLNETQIECQTGDFDTLLATILPENATDQTVTWTCSDPNVVHIYPGGESGDNHTCDYEPHTEGNATITATVSDKSATCEITVYGPE
jgi:uncharacterized protein YjdB